MDNGISYPMRKWYDWTIMKSLVIKLKAGRTSGILWTKKREEDKSIQYLSFNQDVNSNDFPKTKKPEHLIHDQG